ncbi:MAG: tyrosine--tRNA ligase [Candidatus Tectomicrobia bacterium]|nr:tyrosine--tRNA ligase [Candidatus Tectomicrobia bacterium]
MARLTRGAAEVISPEELRKKLAAGRPLRVKAGFDPTAPDLHLGHTVLIQKLRHFQDLGHHVLFLIGDFTARIGDPTGVSETRPLLTEEQVRENTRTYERQVFKILDPRRTEVVFNSRWLGRLAAGDLIRLAAHHTVARMLERDDFHRRHREGQGIGVHEFLYPILQGYDSVELRADVELGGTDQKFNLLVGRDLQRAFGQEPQVVLTLPLLVGTDGRRKMSKSLGNHIGIDEPPGEIYGKVMSIPDELMWSYFDLLSGLEEEALTALRQETGAGLRNPRDVKADLAAELTARFHGREAAENAAEEFDRVFRRRSVPSDVEKAELAAREGGYWICQILTDRGLTKSNGEARRLIQQGGVQVNQRRVDDVDFRLAAGTYLVQVGKRRFLEVTIRE